MAQLGYMVEVIAGGRLGLTKTDDYRSSGIPAFSASGQDGLVDVTEFEQDGVVLSAIGAQCGKCFYATGAWTTLANVQVLLPNPEILARYLYYRVNQDNYWPRSGSAQPFIKPSAISKCWILLPPLAEQRRIAEILDAADEAIQQSERVIAKLREVKKGLLHDLLTRGLDAEGNLRDPEAHPEQFKDSPLGRIPREWEVRTTSEFCSSIADGTHETPQPSKSGYPLVTSKNLKEGRISWKDIYLISKEDYQQVIRRSWVEEGDILFSMIGTLGNVVMLREEEADIATKNVGILRLNRDSTRGRWLLAVLRSAHTQRQIGTALGGSTQKFIALGTLRSFLVPVPSRRDEMLAVSRVLDAHDGRIRAEEATLDKLQQVKRGLMDDLLTGRVRV